MNQTFNSNNVGIKIFSTRLLLLNADWLGIVRVTATWVASSRRVTRTYSDLQTYSILVVCYFSHWHRCIILWVHFWILWVRRIVQSLMITLVGTREFNIANLDELASSTGDAI